MIADTIALERAIATDQGPAFLDTLRRIITGGREETHAETGARYRKLVLGVAEPLRQSCSENEFRAAYDLVDGGLFLRDMMGIVTSPAFPEAVRLGKIAELDPRRQAPRNQRAFDLLEDLQERAYLLFGGSAPREMNHSQAAALVLDALDTGEPFLLDFGRYLACSSSLTYAAFGREMWEPWQVGLLWMFGERALKAQAKAMGLKPEEAVARMTTRRERDLMRRQPDRATSDEGLALLGLDS